MKKLLLSFLFLIWGITNGFGQVVEDARPVPHNLKPQKIIYIDNSILITTIFPGQTFKFGNQTFSYQNGRNLILRFDMNWNPIWGKQFKTGINFSENVISEIKTDKNKDIFISGRFINTLAVDSVVVFSNSFHGFPVDFLMKLDLNGSIKWSRKIIANTTPATINNLRKLNTITPDDNGNLIVSGSFINQIEIEGTTYNNTATVDFFIINYSSSGNLRWVKHLPRTESALLYLNGPSGNDYPLPNYPVAISKSGDIFYSGCSRINNDYKWNGSYLTKLNPAGNQQWSKFISGGLGTHIAIDKDNNLVITGISTDTLQFDNIIIPNNSPFPEDISFITKSDFNGNWLWAKTISLPDKDNKYHYNQINNLFIDQDNNYNIVGNYASSYELKLSQDIIIGGFPFNGLDRWGLPQSFFNTFLAQFSSHGTPNWAESFHGDNEWPLKATSDEFNNHLIIGGYYNNNQLVRRNINLGSFTLLNRSWDYNYFAKVSTTSNFIKGNIYLDHNNNSLRDSTEEAPQGLLVQVAAPNFSQAFQTKKPNGNYTGLAPTGKYTVSIPDAPKYYTVDPPQHIILFSGSGSTKTGKDFRLIPTPNVQDLAVTVTVLTPPRPGFPLRYRLTYQNVGTVPLSDSISLTYDNRLTYDSTSVTISQHQNQRLKWHFQNLQPLEKRQLDVYFRVPANITLGDSLTAIAKIGPAREEIYVLDNADTVEQIIVGSFDPNDKTVIQRTITTTQLANGDYLDYLIRFQNTGTDTAFTVMVRDVISEKHDLASIEMLASSHPFKFELLGKGVVKWQFDNILLADSNRNEAASHGFIRFRIKPQPTLLPGDTIANTAAIFFDYNEPVITNTAITRVVTPKRNFIKGELNLYPNPASESVELATDLEAVSSGEIRVYDRLGKLVYQESFSAESQLRKTVPLKKLSKGMYLVQVQAGKVNLAKRLVVL